MEILIVIRWPDGDRALAAALLERRAALEHAIVAGGIGEVVDSGTAVDGLEIFVEPAGELEAARDAIARLLVEHGLSTLATTRAVEPPPPRLRPPWQPGDCLALDLGDGTYGAAIVLAQSPHEVLVGTLRYRDVVEPAAAVFEARDWLVLDHHAWESEQELLWCDAEADCDLGAVARVVGRTELRESDPRQSQTLRDVTGLALQVRMQSEWDAERGQPWRSATD